jgi:radical SAM protein with 4Fe4S-binding SPASM domain
VNWVQIARMGVAWLRGSVTLGYAPKLVSIEPTNICNYRCHFCPQSDPAHHELPTGFMTLENFQIILDKVLEAGAAWSGTISFTHDGEPTLHRDLATFIRLANERGLRPRFSSNGSKLTPEKADQYEAGGYFCPSIDFSGSREIFEKYRGKTGHWEVIRDHLAYLIRMSNRNPKVTLEITEMGGFERPEESRRFLEVMKGFLPRPTSNRVRFAIRYFHNAAGAAPKQAPLVQLTMPNGAPAPAPSAPATNGHAAPARRQRYRQCPYPWSAMAIAWNGDVHACGRDLEGRTRLGNVLECDSLWDVWNGEKFRQFRSYLATRQPEKLGACSGCDLPWSGAPEKWKLSNIYRVLRYR